MSYTAAASSQDTGYPVVNLYDYAHLRRQWRSLVAAEVTIVFNYSAAKAVLAVFLDDVNFANCFIAGNETDAWGSPSFAEVEFAISNDIRVNRRKVMAVLTGFNYQYLRVRIPAQTPTDGLSVFRIGRVACMDTVFELSANPNFPYREEAGYPDPVVNSFLSGGEEIIEQGDYKIFQCSFDFKNYNYANESDFWTIDAITPGSNVVLYENLGDTSRACLCRKLKPIQVSWQTDFLRDAQSFGFKERI